MSFFMCRDASQLSLSPCPEACDCRSESDDDRDPTAPKTAIGQAAQSG